MEPAAATGPLAGIRVIDISTVMAGPFATHLLADQGADVIKVEPPEGDIMRHSGAAPQPGMSPIFQHMNRNKRSIVLDLKQPAGMDVLMDLVRDADVFVYNMRPKAMERLGLGYERLREVNERVVYCGIVGYGQDGPYADRPAYDDLIQGVCGIAHVLGEANRREPHYVPFALCDRIAGLYAANALLAALVRRGVSGRGAAIEIPMFETSVHFLMVEHLFAASFDPPLGAPLNRRMMEPNRRPYRTRDGYVCVLPYSTKHWHSLFAIVGRQELCGDPRFADFSSRRENIGVLYQLLTDALVERTTGEWLASFEAADIPAARASTPEDLLSDPHLQATGFFRRVAQPGGDFIHMTPPGRWQGEGRREPKPAPSLARDTHEILREVGYDDARVDALVRQRVLAG